MENKIIKDSFGKEKIVSNVCIGIDTQGNAIKKIVVCPKCKEKVFIYCDGSESLCSCSGKVLSVPSFLLPPNNL